MLINANALSIPLADKSVHLVVTSPPYYGLRDYQIDGQIGLEQTPEEYVNNLVAVFREVRRVLADDGIVYLNLGDSYAGSGCGTNDYRTEASRSINKSDVMFTKKPPQQKLGQYGYKPKDLLGIPWMVAFALRADGWYLRQDIIWAKACSGNIRKGSAMPESVTDRFQKSHEYIFLLSKSPRYYFDNEAVKEKCVTPDDMQVAKRNKSEHKGQRDPGGRRQTTAGFDKINKVYEFGNRRSVWFVNPKPYKGAHYATFPPELVRLPILAGTSEKGHCPKCGARWERVMESIRFRRCELPKDDPRYRPNDYNGAYGEINGRADAGYTDTTSIGWQSTCDCGLEPVPDIVLDPFCGSGTTLMVAKEMGRQAIGLDLSFQYLDTIAKPRLGILLGG